MSAAALRALDAQQVHVGPVGLDQRIEEICVESRQSRPVPLGEVNQMEICDLTMPHERPRVDLWFCK